MRRLLWVTVGLMISISLHLLVAWLWFREDIDMGAPELGQDGLTITLAEPGALAGGEVAEGAQDAQPPEPAEEKPREPEPVAEPVPDPEPEFEPEADPEPVPEAEVEPEPEPESEPLPEPEIAEAVAPEMTMAAEPDLVEPEILEPLPLPEIIAADGIVPPRKKKKRKPLPVPEELQPLTQAQTVAQLRTKRSTPLGSADEKLRPIEVAKTTLHRKQPHRVTVPDTPPDQLKPLKFNRIASTTLEARKVKVSSPQPQAAPKQLQPLQVARAAPPPPPDRPRELVREPDVPKPVKQAKPAVDEPRPTSTQPGTARKSAATETSATATNAGAATGKTPTTAASTGLGKPGGTGDQRRAGEGGKSTASQGGTGSGQAARRGGSRPGAKADYLQTIRAWLEKHKRYPRRAKRRQQEGQARLRFILDRNGKVLSYEILRGTGHDKLDDAVHDMIRRAQPLPAMPSDLVHQTLAVTVPVSFSLR